MHVLLPNIKHAAFLHNLILFLCILTGPGDSAEESTPLPTSSTSKLKSNGSGATLDSNRAPERRPENISPDVLSGRQRHFRARLWTGFQMSYRPWAGDFMIFPLPYPTSPGGDFWCKQMATGRRMRITCGKAGSLTFSGRLPSDS